MAPCRPSLHFWWRPPLSQGLWHRHCFLDVSHTVDLPCDQSVLFLQDWQIPLGRRFRALKLWFVMRSYGVQGLQGYLRHHLALAKLFEGFVVDSKDFELTATPIFGLVCFRAKVRQLMALHCSTCLASAFLVLSPA